MYDRVRAEWRALQKREKGKGNTRGKKIETKKRKVDMGRIGMRKTGQRVKKEFEK